MVSFFNTNRNKQQTHPITRFDAEAIKKQVGDYINAAGKLDNPANKTACTVLQQCQDNISTALNSVTNTNVIHASQNDESSENQNGSKSSRAFVS